MYWRGFRIWQAVAESDPLRKGQLRITGKAANFAHFVQPLAKGNLYLHPKAASLGFVRSFSPGNLHITGHILTVPGFSNPMAKGALHITGKTLNPRQARILNTRMLNITGKAATFTLSTSWHDFVNSTLNADNAGWSGYTLRQVIKSGGITSPGGTHSRVTLTATLGAGGFVIDSAYIGRGATAGNDYAFNTTPTQLLFSGSASVTIAQGSSIVSDSAAFAPQTGENMVITFHFSATSAIRTGNSGGSNHESYYKFGSDASTQAATGYTSFNTDSLVSKVEGS